MCESIARLPLEYEQQKDKDGPVTRYDLMGNLCDVDGRADTLAVMRAEAVDEDSRRDRDVLE